MKVGDGCGGGGGGGGSFLCVNRSDKYFRAEIKHFNKAVNSFYIHFNNTADRQTEEEDTYLYTSAPPPWLHTACPTHSLLQ